MQKCAYKKCQKPLKNPTDRQKFCPPPADCKRLAYNESRRKPVHREKCRYCGKEFETSKQQFYCPRPAICKQDYERFNKRLGKKVNCRFCGGEFNVSVKHKAFCTDRCAEKWNRGDDLTPDEQIKKNEIAQIEKKIREDTGRTKILCDLLTSAVERVNPKDIKPYRPPKQKARGDPETMVILISDLHPGLVTPSYNLDIFHKRFDLLINRIVRIKDIISKTIPLKKVVLLKLGDLVSGQGIFPGQAWKSETHVTSQIYEHASPELIRLNLTLLDYFPIVEDHYIPGNHGQTGKYNPREANWDTVAAQDVQRRFEFVDRVQTSIEWDWYKIVDIYKWRFLCIHGNQIRSWLNIPFYGLVNKGMRWQGSIPDGPWHYMVHGHWHTAFAFPWNNFYIIGNGSTVSGDDFALRELGMSSSPAQQVFGVHERHGLTWRYTLDLSAA